MFFAAENFDNFTCLNCEAYFSSLNIMFPTKRKTKLKVWNRAKKPNATTIITDINWDNRAVRTEQSIDESLLIARFKHICATWQIDTSPMTKNNFQESSKTNRALQTQRPRLGITAPKDPVRNSGCLLNATGSKTQKPKQWTAPLPQERSIQHQRRTETQTNLSKI
jgi:hypothetical protein